MKNSFFKIALSAVVILLTAMILTGTAQAWKGVHGSAYYMDDDAHYDTDRVHAWDSAPYPLTHHHYWDLDTPGPSYGQYQYGIMFTYCTNPVTLRVERESGQVISLTYVVNLPEDDFATVNFYNLPYYETPTGGGEE